MAFFHFLKIPSCCSKGIERNCTKSHGQKREFKRFEVVWKATVESFVVGATTGVPSSGQLQFLFQN